MFYLRRTPYLFTKAFSEFTWRGEKYLNGQKTVYLTFDDGPIKKITPWVLSILNDYDIKATFFCVGENVVRNKKIYNQILSEGHRVGNHTFNHLNGWRTKTQEYYENIKKCNSLISSNLFRPPYGKIKNSQKRNLLSEYKIIMWDVIAGDFDKRLSQEKCLSGLKRNTRAGSIVVFHDNIKSFETLSYVLPKYIEFCNQAGFVFCLL